MSVQSTHDVAVWHCAGPHDVGLLRARYIRQRFPRHAHDCFVFCINERGAHASWYAGANVVIPERAITVVPPGEVHTGEPVPGHPWHYRAIYPSCEMIAVLAEEIGLPHGTLPTFPALFMSDAPLADAFARAHSRSEMAIESMEREGVVAEILMTVLQRHATLARRAKEPRAPHRAIDRAKEYVHACHSGRVTLDAVAEAAAISRYAVLRAFRREVGVSPYSYVTQVRVEHAKRLLWQGVPIAAVSQRVGFADQSHLTRHFKRLLGVTPGAFIRDAG